MTELPQVTRTYRNAILDSTYWNSYAPRDGDIVISTSIKAGTTWTQRICAALVFQSPELKEPVDATSPWLDMRSSLPEFVQPILENQKHRRFIKSHLPLDATPYFEQVKYLIVCRDARDVFMSLMPHHYNITPEAFDIMNTRDGVERVTRMQEQGMELGQPEIDAMMKLYRWEDEKIPHLRDISEREFWKLWISKSPFPWEHDGYPYWSHLYHLNSWWQYKHLDNILFVHYADMLKDLDGQMRRISEFLDIPVNEEIWPSLVDAATFETMKENHADTAPATTHGIWKDSKNFFHKGTNGRWREILNEEDLKLYDEAMARELPEDAARWMEQGSLVAGYPR